MHSIQLFTDAGLSGARLIGEGTMKDADVDAMMRPGEPRVSRKTRKHQPRAIHSIDPFRMFAREHVVYARQPGLPTPADALARQQRVEERVAAIERLKLARLAAKVVK